MNFHIRLAARGYYVSSTIQGTFSIVTGPSQNRACAINAHGSSSVHSHEDKQNHLRYLPQFCFHDISVTVNSSCFLYNSRTDVVPFPPAALPAFTGTTAPSDSLIPVCLSPFIIGCPAYLPPCKRFQGLPGSHVFTMSDMPCSQTPGKRHRLAILRRLCVDFRYLYSVILPMIIIFRGSITSTLRLTAVKIRIM